MSGIMKALLLLAVMVCFSAAQYHSSQTCLCGKTQGLKGIRVEDIKDLHMYPQTVFCSQVEIVVTLNEGRRFCLNAKKPLVKRLMDRMLKKAPAAVTTSQRTSQA